MRIKSVHGSTHFFTCGLFVLIIVVSLNHQEVKFTNTDASGDHNLEERASSTTKEPNQQNRFTPLENPLIKMFVDTPQPSAAGKDLLENLRTIPSIRPNTAPYPR
jgi:hypothetical protein